MSHPYMYSMGCECTLFFLIFLDMFKFVNQLWLWGPNDLCARPIYPGRIKRPKPRRAMAQTRQDSLWIPPRVVQSSADPKYPQKEG